jgi:hypothetical protein
MITIDHMGEGGVWSRPKYDHEILEQHLTKKTNLILTLAPLFEVDIL